MKKAKAAKPASRLDYRVLYAINCETIDWAARIGMNWVIVRSYGHARDAIKGFSDDLPVVLERRPKVAGIRRKNMANIRAEFAATNDLIQYAHKKGLKVAINAYEVCVPVEVEKAYPEIFDRAVGPMDAGRMRAKKFNQLCLTRPEVRNLVYETLVEILRGLSGLDAFCYTFHESMFGATISHRCRRCLKVPYDRMAHLLYQTVQCAVDEAGGGRMETWVRLWGMAHSDDTHGKNHELQMKWGLRWGETARLMARQNHKNPYRASRDLPRFFKRMAGEPVTWVDKLPWGDYTLNQPHNPYIGKMVKPFRQIGEISFEHCPYPMQGVTTLIGDQMTRLADYAKSRGLCGLAGVPVSWGASARKVDVHGGRNPSPSQWGLNEANLALFGAVAHGEGSLTKPLAVWLRRRYGAKVPDELVKILLELPNVQAGIQHIRGVSITMGWPNAAHFGNVDSLQGRRLNMLWYMSHFKDGQKRVWPDPKNFKRIFEEKEEARRQLSALVARYRKIEKELPARARKEMEWAIPGCEDWADVVIVSHRIQWMLWQMEEGYRPVNPENTQEILDHNSYRTWLVATRPYARELWTSHMLAVRMK